MSKIKQLNTKFSPNLVETVLKLDPTKNHKYTEWILSKGSRYIKQAAVAVNFFNNNQDRMTYKDIYQYKSLKQLQNDIKTVGTSRRSKKENDKISGATKIFENNQWCVIHLKNKWAAEYYGSNTKWCISGHSMCDFESYLCNNNQLYVIIDKFINQKFCCLAAPSIKNVFNIQIDLYDAKDKIINFQNTEVASAIIQHIINYDIKNNIYYTLSQCKSFNKALVDWVFSQPYSTIWSLLEKRKFRNSPFITKEHIINYINITRNFSEFKLPSKYEYLLVDKIKNMEGKEKTYLFNLLKKRKNIIQFIDSKEKNIKTTAMYHINKSDLPKYLNHPDLVIAKYAAKKCSFEKLKAEVKRNRSPHIKILKTELKNKQPDQYKTLLKQKIDLEKRLERLERLEK